MANSYENDMETTFNNQGKKGKRIMNLIEHMQNSTKANRRGK